MRDAGASEIERRVGEVVPTAEFEVDYQALIGSAPDHRRLSRSGVTEFVYTGHSSGARYERVAELGRDLQAASLTVRRGERDVAEVLMVHGPNPDPDKPRQDASSVWFGKGGVWGVTRVDAASKIGGEISLEGGKYSGELAYKLPAEVGSAHV